MKKGNGFKMKEKIVVGIIDDDDSKIVNISTNLLKDANTILENKEIASQDKKNLYNKYEILPIKIELNNNIESMMNNIYEKKVNVLLIDYKLTSFAKIKFSGIDLAKRVNDEIYEFPIFILTSYEEDLYDHEIFDSYQIFDYRRYMEEKSETLELNYKIVQQFLMYKKKLKNWEDRLLEIIPYAGTSSDIDDEIFDLDYKMSKSVYHNKVASRRTKRIVCSDKMEELLSKLEGIVNDYDK